MLQNNWFRRQLCVHRDMKRLGSLESTQEARVALGYALEQLLRPIYTARLCRMRQSRTV